MEIERKWMVNGWPEGEDLPLLPLKEEFAMRQGYISVRPTVRIREEALKGGRTAYILCFKSGGGLAREEIEREIDAELFRDLAQKIIGKPLIPKIRRSYQLPDGFVLDDERLKQGKDAFGRDYFRELLERENTFTMEQFAASINEFLSFRRYDILPDRGKISARQAREKAEAEYNLFNPTQKIVSDFDRIVKEMNP